MYKVSHGERKPITVDEWLRIFENIGKHGIEHYSDFSNEIQQLERIGAHGFITQSISNESDLKKVLSDYKDIIQFLMKMDIYMDGNGNPSLGEDSLYDFFNQLQTEQLTVEDYIKVLDKLKGKGITVINKISKGYLSRVHRSVYRNNEYINKIYSDGTINAKLNNFGFKKPNWSYRVNFEPNCNFYIENIKYYDSNISIPLPDLETYMYTETFNINTSKVPEKKELDSTNYNPKKVLRIINK